MPVTKLRQKSQSNNPRRFWNIAVKKDDDGKKRCHLYLYGIIATESWFEDEVTPKKFQQDLEEAGDVDELIIHIFSDGGDVFAGLAIYSIVKQYNKPVTVYIEGIAASIATVIAMAADKIHISSVGMMMVHNPWVFLFGGYNADDLMAIAGEIEKMTEPLIAIYASRTGESRDEIIAWMDGKNGAGTWFSAEECLAIGFADDYILEETEELKAVACISPGKYRIAGRTVDLTRYPNAPALQVPKIENEVKRGGKVVAGRRVKNMFLEITCPNCSAVFEWDTASDADGAAVEIIESGDERPENRRLKNEVFAVVCPECGHEFDFDSETEAPVEETAAPMSDFQRGVKAERQRIAALDELDKAAAGFPEGRAIVAKARKEGTSASKAQKEVIAAMANAKRTKDIERLTNMRADGTMPPLGNLSVPAVDGAKAITNGINAIRGIK